jgi:photosystem II stability/assembly factor-like uncharacterized protein
VRADNGPVGEPRRLRAALAVAAACVVVAASAIAYLRPGPLRPAAPSPAPAPAAVARPAAVRLQDFEVLTGLVAWACLQPLPGGAGIVYATRDGGRTWRRLPVPAAAALGDKFGLQVIDRTHAMLLLGRGILATADGGRTWRPVPPPPGEGFGLGAHFLSPSQGWYLDLAVYPGRAQQPTAMWWTADGGATWSKLWSVDAQHLQSGGVPLDGTKYVLGFRDPQAGWLAVHQGGSGRLFGTSDGGRSWSPVALPLGEPAALVDLELLPGGAAVLLVQARSGWLALPSRDGGRTWEVPRPVPIGPPPPGGGYDRPSFGDHDHWAVAAGPRLRLTSDAGTTWREVVASLPAGVTALHDLWLVPGGQGWATADGTAGNLLVVRTSDGGAHWARSPVPGLAPS